MFRRIKDHHSLPRYSPLLKKTCVRQVVLDKWFPLILARADDEGGVADVLQDAPRGLGLGPVKMPLESWLFYMFSFL